LGVQIPPGAPEYINNFMSFITIILLSVLLFVVITACVFIGGWIMNKIWVFVDGLDGEVGENNGPKIIKEFTLPKCDDEMEQFKKQLLEERDNEIRDFVVEDLKDGILGNLKRK
jgi:flagellar basal body-associated protein FliL